MTRRVPWPVFVLVPALMFAVGLVPPEVGAQTWNPSSSVLAEAEDSRFPIVALATFVAVWPRLWTHPFLHLHEAWLKLKIPHTPEPYLGTYTTDPTQTRVTITQVRP